jgi:uncharacterized protein YdeI (YjbR/CyaY-like superfamily)
MTRRDPRIDAYIQRSAPFARPILDSLRETVHATCTDVEETLKWGVPHFMYGGAILCAMAAFRQHATFGFWKAPLLEGLPKTGVDPAAMGQFGRLTALRDLPSRAVLQKLLRQAMKLNQTGARVTSRRRDQSRPEPAVPDDLGRALAGNDRARATFEAFPPSQRREYIEWISEAKQAATRQRRLTQTLDWLAEGKRRNWKYETKRETPSTRRGGRA